jgi:hypothetical protein
MQSISKELTSDLSVESVDQVSLVDFDSDAEEKIILRSFYPHSRQSLGQLRQLVGKMDSTKRKKILDEYISRRQNRRDKPGRSFEQIYYTFDCYW